MKINFDSNIRQTFGIALLCLLTLLWSCESEKKESPAKSPRIRKMIQMDSPKNGGLFEPGASVPFSFSHRKSASIDSVIIEHEGETLVFTTSTFEWSPNISQLGNQSIKATVYAQDVKEVMSPKVRFKSAKAPKNYTFRIINTYPHDENAYTQGLFFLDDNTLIESTGQRGSSSISKLNIQTGEVVNTVALDSKYFGEGATLWNDKIYQLTWTSQIALVYDQSLNSLQSFNYVGQGWGIAVLEDQLFMSNGSEKITILDPNDFSEKGSIEAYDENGPVSNLNELEFVNGVLYANVYTTDKDEIVMINPKNGQVTGRIDFTGIIDRSQYAGFDYVLNGIAWHPDQRLFVTGKYWPQMFEVELIEKETNL
ncbi:MAG: glutaminyl-peptide cyclotransferase [Cyclobacteriaceae bacterium]